jgi:hypothetical protein
MSGLEKGAIASVDVTGPNFARIVKRPTQLPDLMPGKYVLRPQTVVERDGVEQSGSPTIVTVKKGLASIATAAYYFVPSTTLTIQPEQTIAIMGPSTGPEILVISQPKTPLTQGDILASAPTVSRLDGYLVDVTHVIKFESDDILDVEPATLSEAIPDGSLNLEKVLSELDSKPSSSKLLSNGIKRSLTRPADTYSSFPMRCVGTGAISVKPSIGFQFKGASASWSLSSASATLNFLVSASLNVASTGEANCSVEKDLHRFNFHTLVVHVGIPVVLTPSLAIQIKGKAEAKGELNQTFSSEFIVSMGGKFPGGFLHDVFPVPGKYKFSSDGGVYFDLSVHARVGVKLYGTLGISLSAGPALGIRIEPAMNPSLTLTNCIHGGFSVKIWKKSLLNYPTALKWCQEPPISFNSPPASPTSISTTVDTIVQTANTSWARAIYETERAY